MLGEVLVTGRLPREPAPRRPAPRPDLRAPRRRIGPSRPAAGRPRSRARANGRLQKPAPDPRHAAADDDRLRVEDVDVAGQSDAKVVGCTLQDLLGNGIAGLGGGVHLVGRQLAVAAAARASGSDRPAATASAAIRAMAVPDAMTSRQPTMPQLCGGPLSSTVTWPSSPAAPSTPRYNWPFRTSPPPIPVLIVQVEQVTQPAPGAVAILAVGGGVGVVLRGPLADPVARGAATLAARRPSRAGSAPGRARLGRSRSVLGPSRRPRRVAVVGVPLAAIAAWAEPPADPGPARRRRRPRWVGRPRPESCRGRQRHRRGSSSRPGRSRRPGRRAARLTVCRACG